MHGPPLTRTEVANVLARKVRHYEEVGLDRNAAVLMTAATFRTEPCKVADLVPAAGRGQTA